MSQLLKVNLQIDFCRDINHDKLSRFLEEMMVKFIHIIILPLMKVIFLSKAKALFGISFVPVLVSVAESYI